MNIRADQLLTVDQAIDIASWDRAYVIRRIKDVLLPGGSCAYRVWDSRSEDFIEVDHWVRAI